MNFLDNVYLLALYTYVVSTYALRATVLSYELKINFTRTVVYYVLFHANVTRSP